MPLGDECLQPAEGSDVLIHKGWPQRHSTSERTPLRRKMLDGGPGDTRGHSQMPDTAHQNRFLPPSPRGRLAWNSELVPSLSFKDPEKSPSLVPKSCKSGEGLVEQKTAPGLHSLSLRTYQGSWGTRFPRENLALSGSLLTTLPTTWPGHASS